MAVKTNIKIITSDGSRLDYATPESLNIKLNRKADDYQKPDTRYGEFSYSFSLPKTKNNARIFGFANANNLQGRFRVNPVSIRVFNNDALLMDGILELNSIKRDSYECVFYSKLTQLIDSLEDLDLRDITTMPIISDWDEETSIRTHINAGYDDSDETSYQFPLVFYNTYYTPYSVYAGQTDHWGYDFRIEGDRPQQNYYYALNRTATGSDNEWYMHQIPLAFYLKSTLEGLLSHVGWNLSGSFWDLDSIKKIIIPYTGDNDVYDSARYTSGGTTYLDTNKFLPKYKAESFLKDIINTFNLFLTVDISNKILSMETYDTMFSSKIAPYDITNKVFDDTIEISRVEEYDFSVNFKDPENLNIMGDNYFMGSSSSNALTTSYRKTSSELYAGVYNHVGETSGEISVGFNAPLIKRMYLRNTDNYGGTVTTANDSVIFMPNLSKQEKYDNDNKKFNKNSGHTTVYNDEGTIKFKSKPTLMYYYGVSQCDFEQQSGKGDSANYFYVDFDDTKQKIGIASPFAWQEYRTNIDAVLNDVNSGSTANMYASYLQSIYMNMGDSYSNPPDFSLVFGDSHNMVDTLYTKFYQNRANRYKDSEILTASMRMNDYDWTILQLNQPIKYNNDIYSLINITNYDIVKSTASIEIIKQI